MPETKRDMIKNALKQYLIPEFQKLGFELVPIGKEKDYNTKTMFGLGILKRRKSHGIEQVEIQLGRTPTSTFRVCFGVIPLEGITFTNKLFVPAEELCVTNSIKRAYEICYRPKSIFTAYWWLWPWLTPTQVRYDKLAQRISKFIPEIEVAFANAKEGPHVRSSPTNYKWRAKSEIE